MRGPARAAVLTMALFAYGAFTGLPAVASTPSPSYSLQVTTIPCGASTAGAPCDQNPQQLVVSWPVSEQNPTGVEISWAPESGRPVGAPSPEATTVTLSGASSAGCSLSQEGTTESCNWPWPTGMSDSFDGTSWILDGTYEVAACIVATSSNCAPDGAYAPAYLALAVPPGPPATVNASAEANGAVLVTWSPPLGQPPDLEGYRVSRDGTAVFSCSLIGSDLGSACPQTLSYMDHPGSASRITYSVNALRLGPDPAVAGDVSSTPASTTVQAGASPNASSPNASSPNASSPSGSGLPPVPVIGSVVLPLMGGNPGTGEGAYLPSSVSSSGSSGESAGSTSGPTLPGDTGGPGSFSESLPYKNAGTTLESGPSEPGPGPNLSAWEASALALLLLAFAAHSWYLREELRLYALRRRLAGIATSPPRNATLRDSRGGPRGPDLPGGASSPPGSRSSGRRKARLWANIVGGSHHRSAGNHRRTSL
jgi:hypothetical protein